MSCHLFLIIIFTLFYELSNGKNYESNISPNIINEDSNIYNLREWINKLVIEIPNDSLKNLTLGIVEDLTLYGITLDNIITTEPEMLDNRIGLNISIANFGINIKGIFSLLITERNFEAYVSKLSMKLPLYLIKDPETGLVKEVDTNGLDIDFDNLEIELNLEIGDLMKDILLAVLKEVLVSLKTEVIEKTVIDLLNNEIGNLFQMANNIILNGAEPNKLNITINEPDISNLKNSSLISAIYYLLNKLTGIEGPLNINTLINAVTNDTGVIRLHDFYNKSINFEINLIDKSNVSIGNIDIGLEDLNISELNTWKNFTALEPFNKLLLYSYSNLNNLTLNISFSIKLRLDEASNLVTNETILYEKILLRTNLVNNTLKAMIQLPINKKKALHYTNKECLNLECMVDLADSNGTGITALSLNETFTYILFDLNEQNGLEYDISDALNKLIDLFIKGFGNKINLFVNGLLNKTAIDLINKEINNYLYEESCPGISDPDDSEIDKTITPIAFCSAFGLFCILIFTPYILGKACKPCKNKDKNIESTSEASYCIPSFSVGFIKEFGRTDPEGCSLFLHPKVPLFWRIFIPLAILSTMALFISSNSGTGASVFVVFKVGRRIQVPSLFDFGLINSVRDFWKAGTYFLSVLVAVFSGIWPYVKLVLMMILFVMPASILNKRKREQFLRKLDAVGKWSILDSYIMTLMLVAFHFHVEFPVEEPSEAKDRSVIDVFVYAAYGFVTLIVGTIISLCLSHILTHLDRRLVEHPDQNKGEKAESYASLISFAENKYLGKRNFRILISILLFTTLALFLVGSFITSFSFYFHGLAGYALGFFDISDHRDYSVIDLGFQLPKSYENPTDSVIIFTQSIYFITIFIMPVAMQLMVIFLWFVPLPRKVQQFLYSITEVLNAWSCLDVFVFAVIAAIWEIGQFTEFIVGDKCDAINPLISKYFDRILDGHNTCFEVRSYLKSGCWLLFSAAIIFFISSNIVMRVCRNALNERLPEHVKEYLKRINEGKNMYYKPTDNDSRETLIQLNNDDRISNINNTRNSNSIKNNLEED